MGVEGRITSRRIEVDQTEDMLSGRHLLVDQVDKCVSPWEFNMNWFTYSLDQVKIRPCVMWSREAIHMETFMQTSAYVIYVQMCVCGLWRLFRETKPAFVGPMGGCMSFMRIKRSWCEVQTIGVPRMDLVRSSYLSTFMGHKVSNLHTSIKWKYKYKIKGTFMVLSIMSNRQVRVKFASLRRG